MSVRRLADENVQPVSFKFNRENGSWAKKKIKDYPKGREASAVIPLLMRAQEQEGWVTKAAIEHVADMLDMPLIRVLEVATFYTQFQLAPVGKRAHIQVCGTTPCMLRGAGDIMDVCKKRIAPKPFELSEDGNMSWEEVECQGACVNAPMIMIFKDSYEDLSVTQMEHIVDRFAAGKGSEIMPGPQIDRVFSAPAGGLTSLTFDPATKSKRTTKTSAKKSTTAKKASGKNTQSPPATKAGRPASHVSEISAAVKTPVGRKKSTKAAAEQSAARAKAGTPSPKRAASIAGNVGAIASKPKSGAATSEKSDGKASPKTAAKSVAPKKAPAASKGPERLKKPKGKADDLKLISGVGPKLEGTLNGLGFWHFAQIAKWKKADVAIVDNELTFKGRIERDDWIKQAKALAKKVK